MKITKKIITAIILVGFMLSMISITGFATDNPTSGTCGDNLTWELNGTTLTISGFGDMEDYYSTGPWGKDITSVSLPDGITSICDFVFVECTSLTNVTIPKGVTRIGEGAFALCKSLTSVIIPNSVTIIGSHAFAGCSSLTSVTIPDSVTTIDKSSFGGCSALTEINVDDNNLNYKDIDGVLFSKDGTNLVAYPCGKTDTSYSVPNSVTTIGYCAFENCDSLTEVTIPNSVTTIGSYAFMDCSSLTSVTIPDSVTYIGQDSFLNCAKDKNITLYGSLGSAAEVYANENTDDNIEFSSNIPSSTIVINGKLTNNGEIQINGLGTLQNLGEIDNKGKISVDENATFLDEGEFSGNDVEIN